MSCLNIYKLSYSDVTSLYRSRTSRDMVCSLFSSLSFIVTVVVVAAAAAAENSSYKRKCLEIQIEYYHLIHRNLETIKTSIWEHHDEFGHLVSQSYCLLHFLFPHFMDHLSKAPPAKVYRTSRAPPYDFAGPARAHFAKEDTATIAVQQLNFVRHRLKLFWHYSLRKEEMVNFLVKMYGLPLNYSLFWNTPFNFTPFLKKKERKNCYT